MYNGRATQPQAPEQKPPISSGTDWSRPRKGSYCEYKQSKLNQVSNISYQQGASIPLGSNIGRTMAAKNSLNKSGIEVAGQRRSSMSFYDKDQTRPLQLGIEKYASREIVDYSKPPTSKYSVQQQSSYEPRYSRPSTSNLVQPQNKGYLQSYLPAGEQYKSNFGGYGDAPVGTIVPVGQRKRSSFSHNVPSQEPYERGLKSRELYAQEVTSKRESRGFDRRLQKNFERDITDRGVVDAPRLGMQRADLQRGKIYHDKSPNQLYTESNRFEQPKYSKYGREDTSGYMSRRDEQRLYGQPQQNEGRSYHMYNNAGYQNEQEIRQPAPYSRNNDRPNAEYESKYFTDRMPDPYASRVPKQNLRSGPPPQSYIPKDGTPTRAKTMAQGVPQGLEDPGLSQSRRQLLIQKSKNLSERMNELSASKKLNTSASKDQKQFKFHSDIDQERIQRIKNNKERVYDSPFKDKIKSTADLRTKYQVQPETNHPQFSNPPISAYNSKSHNVQPESVLKKTDMNDASKSIERSQQLIKKLNHTKESFGAPRKGNIQNEINKQFQTLPGPSSSIDSNCMNRINALNNKINEKISMLINAYQK